MISAAERRAKIEKLRRDREAKEEERKERERKRLEEQSNQTSSDQLIQRILNTNTAAQEDLVTS